MIYRKAGVYLLLGQVYTILLRLVANLVITRFVSPEEFGLVAIANVLLLSLAITSEVGIKQSIVRREQDLTTEFLATAWTMQLLRGGALFLLLILVAIVFFQFGYRFHGVYSSETLPWIILVLAFNPLIFGFESVKVGLASRSINYSFMTLNNMVTQTVGFFVAIFMAYQGYGVWALIASPLVSGLLYVVFGHLFLHGENIFFTLQLNHFWEIFSFGKWVFLSSLVGFICYYGDQLIFGIWVGGEEYGYYALCFFILGVVRSLSSRFSNEVGFAGLSEVHRSTPELMLNKFYALRYPVDFILLISSGALFICAEDLIRVFYDDRYHPAGAILKVLALALFFERYSSISAFLMAIGKSNLVFINNALRSIALVFSLWVAFQFFNSEVAIWVLVLYRLVDFLYVTYLQLKFDVFSITREVFSLLLFLPGLLVGGIVSMILDVVEDLM